jgi:hypothetical protein
MKAQKLLIAVSAALVLLLAVAQVDSFAKLNGDVNDAIRQGKRMYVQPSADEAVPFVKGVYHSDDALPVKRWFQSSVVPEFLTKLIEASYIGYQEFRDIIRLPRYGKFEETERASYKHVKVLIAE